MNVFSEGCRHDNTAYSSIMEYAEFYLGVKDWVENGSAIGYLRNPR